MAILPAPSLNGDSTIIRRVESESSIEIVSAE
jgi:hypothetical protein